MFKIGSQRLTWMTVEWTGLDLEGYEVTNKVDMQVELVDQKALLGHIERERVDNAQAIEFATKVTKDWRGVGNANGESLPFSADNFDQLWQAPGFASAWGQQYLMAWNGQGKEREKNLPTSPAGGLAGGQ